DAGGGEEEGGEEAQDEGRVLVVPDEGSPVGRDDAVAQRRSDHAPMPAVGTKDVSVAHIHSTLKSGGYAHAVRTRYRWCTGGVCFWRTMGSGFGRYYRASRTWWPARRSGDEAA